jgi:peptidoglycan hydrolase-like protein with peptidoglycan-binding domain
MDQLPSETLVAFSTRPGQLAVDGEGEHSPFTAALLEHIEEPGLELDLLFRKVRDDVLARTSHRQEPRTYEALGAGPFYFKPPRPNRLPVLPPLARLQIPVDAGPTPVLGELPSDPDGDPLSAEVAGLPASGDVLVGDRALQRGDVLTMPELGRAVYQSAEGVTGAAGSFDFVVQDDRGGAAFGLVPITIVPTIAAPDRLPAELATAALEVGPEPAAPPTTVSSNEAVERALGLTPADWRAVQRGLNRLGHAAGPEDGLPGPRTRQALAVWQGTQGAEPSGYLSADQVGALRAAPATAAALPSGDGDADLMATTDPAPAPQLAYVWGHEPETASYVPSTLYNRGPDGRASVRRSGIGSYEVEVGSLLARPGANVQLTSYGAGSAYCNLAGWGEGTVGVRCFVAGGEPSDANFSLLVVRAEADDPDVAYALADQPAGKSYVAPAETAHNRAGPVAVARSGIGQYVLQFGEIAGSGANVQVTTIGAAGERCAVDRWTGGRVQVRCTTSDGQPADAAFSVLVVRARGGTTDPSAEARFVYLWAPDRAEAEFRVPAGYTHGADRDVRVTRSAPGRYVVRLGPVIGERGGNAQVTAYGPGRQYCKIERWFAEDVEVRCFDPAGRPANAPFSLLFARAAGD